jgi:SAM-dependent MidA family methyltransferase
VNALKPRIIDAIRINGPMPVSLYMLMCLHDPKDGYYATRPGFNEDFTTAPETSQVFGELLGLWAAHEWRALGSPERFWLIELGPGRGTMMADMLRAARAVEGFSDAVQIALVEASPTLRKMQAERLAPRTPKYFDDIDAVPPGPSIIVGNEFLDCLAIRQFVRDRDDWRERQIGSPRSNEIAFGLSPPVELPDGLIPRGDAVELAPALETMVETVARRFKLSPGRALLIDYGPDDHSPGDTLRAFSKRKQVDPLADPGGADLTADVDFPRLRRLAGRESLAVHGPIQQGYFLTRLGALERSRALATANPGRADEITAAVKKLVAPGEMGSRFKAICLAPQGAATPPGF